MSTQKAVVHKSAGIAEVRNDVPLPKLRDAYILVKTKAIALNPTDWKSLRNRASPGAIVGCDYSGIVEEIGKDVTTPFKVGDRVAGFVRGGDPSNHENGGFAQHIAAKGDIQIQISNSLTFEDAATLGVGITTVGQGLYQSLKLPLPPNKVSKPTPILIYGASTATGTLAVQFAKLSGLEVLATSSPHNFDLVRKLGADSVFDYKDPDVGAKIREATNDELRLVFDCISEGTSPAISAAAISSKGGHYSTLLPVADFPRDDVKVGHTLGYTAIGERYNDKYPASREDFEFAVKFWRLARGFVNDGTIRPHPAEVRKGLEGVPQGLKDLEEGKVSGVKLVYTVE